MQPDVNHFKCAKHLTIAGTDIYHPTQDHLSGAEIAFGGDLIRCLKNDNYLVLETEAQGYPGWTPYDGQLRAAGIQPPGLRCSWCDVLALAFNP